MMIEFIASQIPFLNSNLISNNPPLRVHRAFTITFSDSVALFILSSPFDIKHSCILQYSQTHPVNRPKSVKAEMKRGNNRNVVLNINPT